ncbi:MAG: hypothetical protein KKF30_00830 [Proteobacteria bacterium]|nr:hypothetical protein [Pseudomonadota bacterium]MBU4471655.1 hypothetical protein [Pseudomonadota bacterium]MCG2751136.1 hypothetical protein [Desulfobacteraceae bacterium]
MSQSNNGSKKQEVSAARIMELSRAFQASRVLLAGYELETLTPRPKSSTGWKRPESLFQSGNISGAVSV